MKLVIAHLVAISILRIMRVQMKYLVYLGIVHVYHGTFSVL